MTKDKERTEKYQDAWTPGSLLEIGTCVQNGFYWCIPLKGVAWRRTEPWGRQADMGGPERRRGSHTSSILWCLPSARGQNLRVSDNSTWTSLPLHYLYSPWYCEDAKREVGEAEEEKRHSPKAHLSTWGKNSGLNWSNGNPKANRIFPEVWLSLGFLRCTSPCWPKPGIHDS
jgi:hypothetical protein